MIRWYHLLFVLVICIFSSEGEEQLAVIHVSIEGDVRYPACEGCPRVLDGLLSISSFCVNSKLSIESDIRFSFAVVGHEVGSGKGGVTIEIDDIVVDKVTTWKSG